MHKYVLYFYNQFVIFSMTVKRAFVSVREDHWSFSYPMKISINSFLLYNDDDLLAIESKDFKIWNCTATLDLNTFETQLVIASIFYLAICIFNKLR